MPNWVKNSIVSKNLNKVKELLLNEEGEVDFNKIIPMPDSLNIISGTESYPAPNSYESKLNNPVPNAIQEVLNYYYNSYSNDVKIFVKEILENKELVDDILAYVYKGQVPELTDDRRNEVATTFIAGFFNYKSYGYRDWYAWCVAKWGCKWNAVDTNSEEEGFLDFNTAWSFPEEVCKELSKQVDFTLLYADEMLGENCGIIQYKNGEGKVLDIDERYTLEDFANWLWFGWASPDGYEEEFEGSEEELDKLKDYYTEATNYFNQLEENLKEE